MAKLTALEVLDDRSTVATQAADKYRADAATRQEAQKIDQKSYKLGLAYGYHDARKIMDAELRRLCNRFQNGCLTIDDFGIAL